jgi:hypothetical protein
MALPPPISLLSQRSALSNVRLVLASQSPRRKEIFNLLGLEGNFEVLRILSIYITYIYTPLPHARTHLLPIPLMAWPSFNEPQPNPAETPKRL